MPELTPNIADDVVAACKAGAAEAGAAFGRALDAAMSLSVAEPGSIDLHALPEELRGPGLAVVLTVGAGAALVLLPESTGLLPAWCSAPDATGQSKLSTLAQELGMLVLPEQFSAAEFQAAHVGSLAAALSRGGVVDGAAMVPLELSAAGKSGVARLVWPAASPDGVFQEGPPPKANGPRAPARKPPRQLPEYSRSLLRIRVPVVVALAENRQPLHRILELGPGSIIQFDKSCEDMLELSAGGHAIAQGEAVKVGDKFGLRITSMILPEERFQPVKPGGK